jgi:homoserine O-acetyltransferase/O-succinyltransferase
LASLRYSSRPTTSSGGSWPGRSCRWTRATVAQAWKWQHADVSRHTGGDLAAALGRITARTCVMPISSDQFFPPEDLEREQALMSNSELRVIEDVHGHVALFGVYPDFLVQVDVALRSLLATDV